MAGLLPLMARTYRDEAAATTLEYGVMALILVLALSVTTALILKA